MESKSNSYNKIIVKSILHNSLFRIEDVLDIEDIKSTYFVKNDYHKIEDLIIQCDIDALKNLPTNQNETMEYLDIIKFKDQSGNSYIATVYDNIELWQNPELIEVYPLFSGESPARSLP